MATGTSGVHFRCCQMAAPTPSSLSADTEDPHVLVFAGSSEADMCHARIFWNSVTLHPPLESRLVSGDITQRLRVAPPPAPQINVDFQTSPLDDKTEQVLFETQKVLKAEERAYYLEKAKKRDEIIALLKKQREDRLKKEKVSLNHKPKIAVPELRLKTYDYRKEELEAVKSLPPLE
ncbi:cilia- and flagella-associated protein HOATZ isoform X1 [Ambystoma mexicanum]|uniref:cilia- and flagella-associated protein HOATZ isoform X1 n=1 Tax=Ambystoma mexicanum TaxID=8296 RepID=UPI0037E871A7